MTKPRLSRASTPRQPTERSYSQITLLRRLSLNVAGTEVDVVTNGDTCRTRNIVVLKMLLIGIFNRWLCQKLNRMPTASQNPPRSSDEISRVTFSLTWSTKVETRFALATTYLTSTLKLAAAHAAAGNQGRPADPGFRCIDCHGGVGLPGRARVKALAAMDLANDSSPAAAAAPPPPAR